MIEPISPFTNAGLALPAARAGVQQKVSEEFLTIFYKEILKQMIKTPLLSPGAAENNNYFSSFNSDVMVEQLANQLAKDQAKKLSWLTKGGADAR